MKKTPSFLQQFPKKTIPFFVALLLSTAFGGCIDIDDRHQEPDPASIWPIGTYWNYEVKGELPADWMNTSVGKEAWPFGHKPKMPIDTNVTLVASLEEDTKNSIFEPYRPRNIYADDLRVSFLQRYGLPFANQWIANKSLIDTQQTTFFDFPIHHGKEWNTEFMGAKITIKVHEANGTYNFLGFDPSGQKLVEYTYDESARWFGDFAILDLEGNVILTAKLSDFGDDHSGTYYELSSRRTAHCIGGSQIVGPGSCEVGINLPNEGIYAWWIDLAFYGENFGSVVATRSTPDSLNEIWFNSQCPCDEHMNLFEIEERLGDYSWTITHAFTGDWFISFLHVDACFVRFEVSSGWTEKIPLHMDQC